MTTTNDMFDGPGSSTGIQWTDLDGRLLLITPRETTSVTTAYGESAAVRADIVVLDGDEAPEEINDTLIFPKVLQGQVRKNAGTGRRNLGRLGKGVAKPGQSAPWLLGDPNDADKTVARTYLSSQEDPPF